MSKTCTTCKQDLPLTSFDVQPQGKHGRSSTCKECKKAWHRNRGVELKEFMFQFLSLHKCVDCGEQRVLCLEFDHKNPLKKSFDLGKAHMQKDLTLKELVKEIAKCEVRCSNCHKIKTHKEQDTWLYQRFVDSQAKEHI